MGDHTLKPLRPKLPVNHISSRTEDLVLDKQNEDESLSSDVSHNFEWERRREKALLLIEPVRLKEDQAPSNQISISTYSSDRIPRFKNIDEHMDIEEFNYGTKRDQSLYSFLYNVGPTAAMLSEDEHQDFDDDSVAFISKIKEIADAQSLSAASLNTQSPLAHAFSERKPIERQPKALGRDKIIGPYGGSRILSWAEMNTLDASRRISDRVLPHDYRKLPQSLEDLRAWDHNLASGHLAHGARASQKRRLRRIEKIRTYYATHEA